MKKASLLSMSVAALLVSAFATPAQAQNARSWVSGTGSGTACTRALPCSNFTIAQDATSDGGSIGCVDSGDYYDNGTGGHTFTISKSLTIDCAGTGAVTGRQNIHIAGVGIIVHLRNMLIDGGFETTSGSRASVGINFLVGAALFIENCTISGWKGVPPAAAQGIRFTPPDGSLSRLVIVNSIITDNGVSSTPNSGGIFVNPAGSGAARVTIERTKILGNSTGIVATGAGATGITSIVLKDSFVGNSVDHGISLISPSGQGQVSLTMDHSASVGNTSDGLRADGAKAFGILTESTIIANFGTGLNSLNGGRIVSYKNNALIGNVVDGSPTIFFSLN